MFNVFYRVSITYSISYNLLKNSSYTYLTVKSRPPTQGTGILMAVDSVFPSSSGIILSTNFFLLVASVGAKFIMADLLDLQSVDPGSSRILSELFRG